MKNKLFLFLLLFYTLGTKASKNDDFSMIMEKIVQSNTIVCSDSIVDTIIPLFQSDGSFSDIDYSLRDRTVWPPIEHLDRLLAMAYSYVEKGRKYYGNHAFFERIQIGLHFWYDNNPISDNRWWWLISEPQKLGLLLMVLDGGIEKISPELIDAIIQRWEERGGNPERESGGNQVDVALHTMYRACLIRDEVLLNRAIYYIFESIKYVIEDDGIRFDNSYMAHGNQLHIGGYGETQLYGQTPVAYYLQGTKFQLEDEKIDLLSKYIRETFMNCIRGQVMAYNAHGRGISRKDYLKRIDRWQKIINSWKHVDIEYMQDYDDFLQRINGLSSTVKTCCNNVYYMADYMLHVRPNYTFSVRWSSDRTVRSEYGNNENLKGYFISDGSTCLMVDGKEYDNLMPLWDWNHIPGITAPILSETPLPAKEWGVLGTSTFCGGVSDGKYGLATYSYYDDYNGINTGAKKGWFCFDDAIICLGSDLSSSHNIVYTEVDQTWGQESFNILFKDKKRIESTDIRSDDISAIQHGNTAYYFPNGGDVTAYIKHAKGKWTDINKSESDVEISGNVFHLAISNDNSNKTYAYYLLPNTNKDELLSKISSLHLKILENNDSIQAVYNEQTSVYEIIFYRAANLIHNGLRIGAFQPCTILLKKGTVIDSLFISDPSHSCQNLKITYQAGAGAVLETKQVQSLEIMNGITSMLEFGSPATSVNTLKSREPFGFDSDKVCVYTLQGRQIIKDCNESEINLKSSGVYIVKYVSRENEVVKKVIVP